MAGLDAKVATLPSCSNSVSLPSWSAAKVTKFSTLVNGDPSVTGARDPALSIGVDSAAAFSSAMVGGTSRTVVTVAVGTTDAPAASPPDRKPEASMRSRPKSTWCVVRAGMKPRGETVAFSFLGGISTSTRLEKPFFYGPDRTGK